MSTVQETKDNSGHRRSRRAQEKEEQMSDPVLEEHAFILWASEHRSEIEQKLPNVSVSEMDALLSAQWCDVVPNVKAKFFTRAREAFSDDDRQMIKAKQLGFGGWDSDVLCGFIMDRDPDFHDFVLLPINRQRDFLRKWLKFFQKMLPRREYIEFIMSFKRACGREESETFIGKKKRMRMRNLDPVHYKTLFDLIRLSKPRVMEAYKERRGKEKKMVSNTYSNMLKNLVNGDPWPHMIRGCRSKLLTELLNDLRHLSDAENRLGKFETSKLANNTLLPFRQANVQKSPIIDNVGTRGTLPKTESTSLEVTISLTEQDFSVLETDVGVGMVKDLEKLEELPILDANMLDDVLQPLSHSTSSLSALLGSRNDGLRLCNYTNSNMDQSLCMSNHSSSVLPAQSMVKAPNFPFPSYNSGGSNVVLPDSMGYPKINIHYRSSMPASTGRLLHRSYPVSHSTAVVSYKMCQSDVNCGYINSGITNSKVRSCSFPVSHNTSNIIGSKGLHTYDSMRDIVLQGETDSVPGRCIKVHPRHNQSQVRMSARPYQVPVGSLGPQSKHRFKSLPLPYGSQQKLPSDMCRQGMVMMDSPSISKFDSTHMVHHNPIGCRINNPSPLITSLSPFRAIKSNTQRAKGQGQHCQIVSNKSKIHYTSGTYHSENQTFWKTGTAHAIPISTTLRPCGSISSRNQNGVGQIKVCLPTQALKIPIAKLRGARKTAFVKGRMKSIHLSSASLAQRSDASSVMSCQSHSMAGQSNQSVLAKVLSFQSGGDGDTIKSGISVASSTMASSIRSSLCSPFVTTSKRNAALQLGNTNNFTNSSINGGDRPDSQVHLMPVRNTHLNTASSSYSKVPVSGQKAVIINPLHLHRRPILPSLGFNSAIVKTSIDRCSTGYRPLADHFNNDLRSSKDMHPVYSHVACDSTLGGTKTFHQTESFDIGKVQMADKNIQESNISHSKALANDENNKAKCHNEGLKPHTSLIKETHLSNDDHFTQDEMTENRPLLLGLLEKSNSSLGQTFGVEESRQSTLQHAPSKLLSEMKNTNVCNDIKHENKENIVTIYTSSRELDEWGTKGSNQLLDPGQQMNTYYEMENKMKANSLDEIVKDYNINLGNCSKTSPESQFLNGCRNRQDEKGLIFNNASSNEPITKLNAENPYNNVNAVGDTYPNENDRQISVTHSYAITSFSSIQPNTRINPAIRIMDSTLSSQADASLNRNGVPSSDVNTQIPEAIKANEDGESTDDAFEGISVESPVKRSGSVVSQSPVLSQIAEMSTTPVTVSNVYRISPRLLNKDYAQRNESPHNPLHMATNIHRNYINICPERKEDKNDSASGKSLDLHTKSTSQCSPTSGQMNVHNFIHKAKSSIHENDISSKANGSLDEAMHVETTERVKDTAQRASITSQIDTSPIQFVKDGTFNSINTTTRSTFSSTMCINASRVSTVNHSEADKGNSVSLADISPMEQCGRAPSNVFTDVHENKQLGPPFTVIVSKGSTMSSDSKKTPSLSPCRKRAHYIHEYLPT